MNPSGHCISPSTLRLLMRACAVWALIAVAKTLHGTILNLFLATVLGDHRARQFGVVVGSIMILVIAWFFIRWIGARSTAQLLAVGLVWLVLMLAFEICVGRAVGSSWEQIALDYNPSKGGLMLIGMNVILLAPLLVARARSAWTRQEESQ
jgi:hypothetical protein